MSSSEHRRSITQDELVVLAHAAGISITVERLPRVLGEVNAALLADADLDDAARRATAAGGEPFDASWKAGRTTS